MIKFRPNSLRLHIAFAIDNNGNRKYNSDALKVGEYSTVVIKQTLKYGNEYRYSITINGKEVFVVSNNKARDFTDVKLYAGDAYFPPSECYIKNLVFENIGLYIFHFIPFLPACKIASILQFKVWYQKRFKLLPARVG